VTVVVTGAAGFIGRAVVSTLLRADRTVVAIDRQPSLTTPGVTALVTDVLAADERITRALHKADAVLHLAGCPGVRDSRPDAAWRRHRDNVLATARVLRDVPPGTPLVVTSSSSVYGGAREGRPCVETDAPTPRGGYADSKLDVERLCQRRLADGGRVVIVRPFTVAGEGQRPDMAIASWIAAAIAGRPLRIFGSPSRTRDITDVRQCARALCELTVMPDATGVVNVGTGMGHTLAALAGAVCRAVGRDVTTSVVPADPVEVSDTLADTTRLHSILGWAPTTDLVDLVARQVAATGRPALQVA
jgi:nucleoside-diphosphate-sugar epimerase